MFLQIKKSSDALLKSDAREDQNQVIFFTSPYVFFFYLITVMEGNYTSPS